jgi:hypothetical protein
MATQTANIIGEADAITGENVTRPMTTEEIAQLEADKSQRAEQEVAVKNRKKLKEAVIAKLGLTDEELSALLA